MNIKMIEERIADGNFLNLAPTDNNELILGVGHNHILVNYGVGQKLIEVVQRRTDNIIHPALVIAEDARKLSSHGIWTFGLFRETENITAGLMKQFLSSSEINSSRVDRRPKYFEIRKLYRIKERIDTLAQLFELISPENSSERYIFSDITNPED